MAIAGPPSGGSVTFSSQDESPMGSPGLNVNELMRIAGPPAKEPTFLDSVVTGVKSAPGAAVATCPTPTSPWAAPAAGAAALSWW